MVASLLVLVSCGGSPANQDAPSEPAYPGASVLGPTRSGGTCCFYPNDGEATCPVLITDYGTNDELNKVADYYEGSGFVRRGTGPTGGEVVRWIGVRDGGEKTWRKVDVATGPIGGHPEWNTFVEVLAPDCGPAAPPSPGGTFTPTPAPTDF
jgi:hypothetical protein